jgi:hypothetical protein
MQEIKEQSHTAEEIVDILQKNAASSESRKYAIIAAENTQFSVEQSEFLYPWLLNYAKKNRNSNCPHTKDAVLSAIRTEASMLTPQQINKFLLQEEFFVWK